MRRDEHVGIGGVRDDRAHAGERRDPARAELHPHAARAAATGRSAGQPLQLRGQGDDVADGPGVVGPGRVPVVEAGHVRQQQQQVGLEEAAEQRGEHVVVAHTERVVLVDHRDHAQRQHGLQGVPDAAAVGLDQFVRREQELAGLQAAVGEGGLDRGVQPGLAERGGDLLHHRARRGEGGVPGAADRDRPGRDQHGGQAGDHSSVDGVAQAVELGRVQPSVRDQGRRADLEHHAVARPGGRAGARAGRGRGVGRGIGQHRFSCFA
nr:hypothetical protein [Kutzneria chonburiensis]